MRTYTKPCEFEGCHGKAKAHGLCTGHLGQRAGNRRDGFDDVLVPYNIVGARKLDRLAELWGGEFEPPPAQQPIVFTKLVDQAMCSSMLC